MLTDSEIIEKLKGGSEPTFRYLYDTYYYKLNLFAYHIVMCEESHDIVHDIFIRMWETRKHLTISTNIKAYLYTSVRNSALNYLRHNKIMDTNHKKITESVLFIQDQWSEEDELMYENLHNIIEELPPQQRTIIKLRFEGMSYGDISEKLNISTKTINNHIYRAYLFMRTKMPLFFFLILNV